MSDVSDKPAAKRLNFRRYWPVLKWLLFALVIVFVGRKAWDLWRTGDVSSVTIRWPWLVAAAVWYAVGWFPSVFFWHRLIRRVQGTCSRRDVAHAFFAGHLGKYVPGKASVLLIRAGILGDKGCRPGLAALTSTYETLVCMGVGAAVGLTLAPIVWPRSVRERLPGAVQPAFDHPLAFALSVVALCVVLVPVVTRLLVWITHKLTHKAAANDAGAVRFKLNATFLLRWCFLFVTTWLLHGLSLGCTLRAVGVATSWSDWLTWTGDVSSASFLGFLAIFAPGGLGVREGVLIGLLNGQPGISQSQAVAATVLLRAAWLVAEIVATFALGMLARRVNHDQTPDNSTAPAQPR